MIGTTEETNAEQTNIDLVMLALTALITQQTDGNEAKQHHLRRNTALTVSIRTEMDLTIVVRDQDGFEIAQVTDARDMWQTWANGLGLRMPEGRTGLGREPEDR